MSVNHYIHELEASSISCSASMTIIFFLLITTITHAAAQLSFNYTVFRDDEVNLRGDARIDAESYIQLTTGEQKSNGQVRNSKLMDLWDNSTRNLTDFTAEFSFNIAWTDKLYADGITFFLAAPNLTFLRDLTGGNGIGIYITSNGGPYVFQNIPGYIFVAVEFDTFYNVGVDPDTTNTSHVGININSITSEASETWNFDVSDLGKDFYAKIDYNSSSHNLSVTFTGYKNGAQIDQHLSHQIDLRNYLPERVMVGFSASTGFSWGEFSLKSWSMRSTLQIKENPASPKRRSKIGLLVGLGALSFFVCFIGLACFLILKRRASSYKEDFISDQTMDEDFEKGAGAKKFSYNELMQATNNFAEAEKLGQGGFGGVYHGFMRDLNSHVAIKRVSKESHQGIKEYATEVKVISQLRHKNLVQLIGWCHQKSDLLLIYEFMPNGSLDFHLFKEHSFLTWQVRYNIAQDLTSALLYLQESWEQCVLHRDIKSSNIMLDSKFNAKLGDFGLAKLVDHGKGSQTTIAAGTIGYMAPECSITGKANKESDIFSFGIVALEIACGRKPINLRAKEGQVRLVEWVWELYGMEKLLDAVDPKLNGEFDIQQMERLMMVGLWCAHPDFMLRPSIKQAIQVLNFEAPLPALPEKMPVPFYLPPSATMSLSSSFTGAYSFEIDNNANQSSKNRGYSCPSQFPSSSTNSASSALLHTI